jgi:hypothetical protein
MRQQALFAFYQRLLRGEAILEPLIEHLLRIEGNKIE